MALLLKYLLLCLTSLLFLACQQAQEDPYYQNTTGSLMEYEDKFRLKGPVKEIENIYVEVIGYKDSITRHAITAFDQKHQTIYELTLTDTKFQKYMHFSPSDRWYDVDYTRNGRLILSKQHRNSKHLRTTYYFYNLNGKLLWEETYPTGEDFPSDVVSYSYKNQDTISTRKFYDTYSGQRYKKLQDTENHKGQPILHLFYHIDGSVLYRDTFIYNDQKQLTLHRKIESENTYRENRLQYDPHTSLKTDSIYSYYDRTDTGFVLLEEHHFYYNANEDPVKFTYFWRDTLRSTTYYDYNQDHQLIQKRMVYQDGYAIEKYDPAFSDKFYVERYEYAKNQQLIEKTIYDFELDHYKNWTKVFTYHNDTLKAKLFRRYQYY